MVLVPADKPETTPVVASVATTEVALLLHVPPDGVAESDEVRPSQNCIVPVTAPGSALTVATEVVTQPFGTV